MGFEQELVALPLLRDYDQISLLEEPRTNLSHPSCSSWGHSRPGEDFKYLPSSEAVQPRLLSQTVSNPFLVLPFISYVSLSKLLNFSHQRMIGTVATSQSYYGIKWLLWVKAHITVPDIHQIFNPGILELLHAQCFSLLLSNLLCNWCYSSSSGLFFSNIYVHHL